MPLLGLFAPRTFELCFKVLGRFGVNVQLIEGPG